MLIGSPAPRDYRASATSPGNYTRLAADPSPPPAPWRNLDRTEPCRDGRRPGATARSTPPSRTRHAHTGDRQPPPSEGGVFRCSAPRAPGGMRCGH